jgi:hypothetical protein
MVSYNKNANHHDRGVEDIPVHIVEHEQRPLAPIALSVIRPRPVEALGLRFAGGGSNKKAR